MPEQRQAGRDGGTRVEVITVYVVGQALRANVRVHIYVLCLSVCCYVLQLVNVCVHAASSCPGVSHLTIPLISPPIRWR